MLKLDRNGHPSHWSPAGVNKQRLREGTSSDVERFLSIAKRRPVPAVLD